MRGGLTSFLVDRCLGFHARELPQDVVAIATHCLLDWMSMALAGACESDARRLTKELVSEASPPRVVAWGSEIRMGLAQAALANGMAAHLLDFDDAHLGSRVHPSAPLWPAILAVCEDERLPGDEALAAFAAGVEMQVRLAALMGESHYHLGWHNTATLGCFGATAAAGRLYRLGAEDLSRALTIAATQAGGLRMAFGTAGKAYQVGRAAVVGVQSARLARSGLDAPIDVFDRTDGFAWLYASERFPDAPRQREAHWHARDIVFKYHASCYGTQAPIEAALSLRRAYADPRDIAWVRIDIEPQYLTVCDVLEPDSALQAKFSVRHMVALALGGKTTADSAGFSQAARVDSDVRALRGKIDVRGDASLGRAQARVGIGLHDGPRYAELADASRPERDLARQWRRLCEKSCQVLGGAFPLQTLRVWHEALPDFGMRSDLRDWARETSALLGKSAAGIDEPRREERHGGVCNG